MRSILNRLTFEFEAVLTMRDDREHTLLMVLTLLVLARQLWHADGLLEIVGKQTKPG